MESTQSAHPRSIGEASWHLGPGGQPRIEPKAPGQAGPTALAEYSRQGGGAGVTGAGPHSRVTRPALSASGQAEAGDPRLPPGRRGLLAFKCVVLVDIPQGAVVHGVDVHRRVVAPARVRRRLHSSAVDDHALAERHLSQRVTGEPARVADAREHVDRIDDAEAKADVALPVHGDAPHPAVHTVVRRVGTLLVEAVGTPDAPDLVPAGAGDSGKGLDGLVGDQGLVPLEVPVGQPPRWPLPVRKDVEILSRVRYPGLRQAVTG